MSANVTDASSPGTRWPKRVALDSNVGVYVLQILGLQVSPPTSPASIDLFRVSRLLKELQQQGSTPIITPTVISEMLHVAIRGRYQHLVQTMTSVEKQERYGQDLRHWSQLYKRDSAILSDLMTRMEILPSLLPFSGIRFLDPQGHTSGQQDRFMRDVIQMSGKYGLDTSDARILLEAQSLGIPHIVTLDRDMQRAAPDFTIYTWL